MASDRDNWLDAIVTILLAPLWVGTLLFWLIILTLPISGFLFVWIRIWSEAD